MHVELRVEDVTQIETKAQFEPAVTVQRQGAASFHVQLKRAAFADQGLDRIRDARRVDHVLQVQVEFQLQVVRQVLFEPQINAQRRVFVRQNQELLVVEIRQNIPIRLA